MKMSLRSIIDGVLSWGSFALFVAGEVTLLYWLFKFAGAV
jgi:hypothetical protein